MSSNTVKLSSAEAVVVTPVGQGVSLKVTMMGVPVVERLLTIDQVGALGFALERAGEAAEQARMLAAAQARAA